MTGDGSTYDNYHNLDLRNKFIELIHDYFLVLQFGGLSGPDDLGLGPAHLAFKYELAKDKVHHFIEVVKAMDVRAAAGTGTPVEELSGSLPDLSDILDAYSDLSDIHERLKPLRELAKAWNLDIGEEVAKQWGRPKGSAMYPTSQSVLAWLRPYVTALRDEGKHPTRELVAERAGVAPNTLRHHFRQFFTWTELLTALTNSPSP